MEKLLSYEEWITEMENKVELLPKVQAIISNFQVLPRLGKLLEEKSEACSNCRLYWQKMQQSTENLDQFFNDGNTYSKDFDDLVEKIMIHLKSQHNIKPKGLVLSLCSVVGMIVGVAIGISVSYFVTIFPLKAGLTIGWMVGTLTGWIVGKLKEERLRKENRIF